MALFAIRSRAASTRPATGPDSAERPELPALPPRLEAVGEALAAGRSATGACAVAGTQLAKDGASLDEALEALGTTYHEVLGTDPSFDDVRTLARSWSDATLAYLHQMACEDPLTGLASMSHVRTRLSELYRGELRTPVRVRDSHALVVAELATERYQDPPESIRARHALTRTMRLSALGDAARTVFAGSETIGQLGADRIVVIVERDDRLGQRVALLRRMARTLHGADEGARVWIEGLPGSDATAALLLDELARS